MAPVSVLIPQRNAGDVIVSQVPEICAVLGTITADYEVIVIDDSSSASMLNLFEQSLCAENRVRVLKFSPACGLSAALTAGVAAARGEYVVALPAGEPCSALLIEGLLDELVRADFVVGRPSRQGLRKAWHRLVRIPRWLVLGLEVRDPECLVWAARREAIHGLELPRGMYRYLATLVAARGYRVGEITVPTQGRTRGLSDGWPNPGDLLAAWWFKRRWRQYKRLEVSESTAGLADPSFGPSDRPVKQTEFESHFPAIRIHRRSA